MAKKHPVSITLQTIYIFIPILSIIAFYSVEKLRLAVLIGVMFLIGSWGIEYIYVVENNDELDFAFYSEHPDYIVMHVALIAVNAVLFVYLIRKWSREWNIRLSTLTSESGK